MTVTVSDLQSGLRAEPDLSRIAGRLRDVAASRFDVVAPQQALHCKDFTRLIVDCGTPQITDYGVTSSQINARYTRTAWRQVAERLRIPLSYLDRLTEMGNPIGPMLASTSINELCLADDRKALYRFINTDDGYWLRAVLSDKYRAIDNDTAMQAIVDGLADNGLGLGDCEITGDVTIDRLRLRLTVPAVAEAVPELLGNYRMPFSLRPGQPIHGRPVEGETPPVIWAGIEITNSETGQGAFSIAPRAVVAVCRNGLTRAVDFRRAHIGAVLEEGSIDWSQETQQAAMALIRSQVRDAVATYISYEYLHETVEGMRVAAGVEVTGTTGDAVQAVQVRLGLSDAESQNVFELFAAGGDRSVLGLAQAVTAAAQLAPDGDRQSEIEATFWTIVGAPAQFVGAS